MGVHQLQVVDGHVQGQVVVDVLPGDVVDE